MAQPFVLLPATGSEPSDEWLRLGVAAQVASNLPQAQAHYGQALRLDPRCVGAVQNLAIVFAQSPGFINEALLGIERAALLAPDNHVVATNQALVCLEAERIDEALSAAKRAVALAPNDVGAMLSLAIVSTTAGHPEDSVPLYNRILDIQPDHPVAGPNAAFVQTLTDCTPKDLLRQRQRWRDAHGYKGPLEGHRNDKNPDRVLRVGYVGGDFKSHSASFIFRRVLLHHTPAVEMYLYSTLPVDAGADASTKRFQEAAGPRWRDISALNDDQAAAQIRADAIDVLVDLAGHTHGGRLAVFTRKPAPVSVTAWGFAHGQGCPEITAFFADPVAVPEAERKDFAERIVDLPCIITFEPMTEYGLKGTSTPPIRKNGYPTFGCYARFEKLSDACLKTFGEILRRVPDAKLELKDHSFKRPYSIRRVMSLMPDIAPDRLLFSTATSHSDHLLAMQQCDIFLDPFPHSGGAVSLEVMQMSVPAITLRGRQPSGRSMASILTCMRRTDWIAETPEQYVEKVVEWSERTKELADARKTLRDELLKSPIYEGYVEATEGAYRQLWKEWCA